MAGLIYIAWKTLDWVWLGEDDLRSGMDYILLCRDTGIAPCCRYFICSESDCLNGDLRVKTGIGV